MQNELKDRRIFYEAVSETYFSAGGCSDGRRADAGVHGAPGDSVETRINNALAQRTGAELYQEIVTTAPDGTAQTMIAARSNGNATLRWTLGDAGSLVYILKDGQGYLVTMHPRWPSEAKYPL